MKKGSEYMVVLIVDDTTFMRFTIRRFLEKNNITTIYEAVNGKDAVTKYKTISPDLVIMDISMPVMNGIDAVIAIRKVNPEANVIICSLQGQKQNVMEAIKAGARGFLLKPFKEDKLMNEIKKLSLADMPVSSERLEQLKAITGAVEGVQESLDYMRGVEAGYLECRREIATNMLHLAVERDIISKCVELSEDEIMKYGDEYNITN